MKRVDGTTMVYDPGQAGHSAVIIPNGNGCTYYSYDTEGKVTTVLFNNINDALASVKAGGYDREQHWNVTAQQATWAREKVAEWNGTDYQVTAHNCWYMVFEAIKAAGTNIHEFGASPNRNFTMNERLADGGSSL